MGLLRHLQTQILDLGMDPVGQRVICRKDGCFEISFGHTTILITDAAPGRNMGPVGLVAMLTTIHRQDFLMSSNIFVFAGSARSASVNKQLARLAAREVEQSGATATLVDLAGFPLPIYNGDQEAAQGIPEGARSLHALIADADGIIMVSPEYNGSITALLKNTIDWVTRVDSGVFAKPTLLASASPGRMGGRNGLDILRATLTHMAVPVLDDQVSVPAARESLVDGELVESDDQSALRSAVATLLATIELEKAA